jgi:hypothetical protein
MGAAQNPTEQLKGIDSRGDAALRQAIATGSPVPTTGEQAKELNSATTLAAENARLRAALTKIAYDPFGNPEATHADLLQTITEFAIATLEGGAK